MEPIEVKEQKNKLHSQRGKVRFTRTGILRENEEVLKEIFSKIFPMAIQPIHDIAMYDDLMYYCYSPYFRELSDAEEAPEYEIIIQSEDYGNIITSTIKEIINN